MKLYERFPETFIVAEEDGWIIGNGAFKYIIMLKI